MPHAHDVIERNPKIAFAPAGNAAAASRLEPASVPVVSEPPPGVALLKPLGGSQELGERASAIGSFLEGNNERT